jgi:hypothetical protein
MAKKMGWDKKSQKRKPSSLNLRPENAWVAKSECVISKNIERNPDNKKSPDNQHILASENDR